MARRTMVEWHARTEHLARVTRDTRRDLARDTVRPMVPMVPMVPARQ